MYLVTLRHQSPVQGDTGANRAAMAAVLNDLQAIHTALSGERRSVQHTLCKLELVSGKPDDRGENVRRDICI